MTIYKLSKWICFSLLLSLTTSQFLKAGVPVDLLVAKDVREHKRQYRLLSIDGGGLKGVGTLEILIALQAQIKKETGQSLTEYFDGFAGTSTGGIIALGLASGFSAEETLKIYEQDAEFIFPKEMRDAKNAPVSDYTKKAIGWILDGSPVLTSAYSADGLKMALLGNFGLKTVASLIKPIFIPGSKSEDVPGKNTHLFRPHLFTSFNSQNLRLSTLARITSSAPLYLPPVRLKNQYFVDGGIVANNPAELALEALEKEVLLSAKDIFMVSIGTGESGLTKSQESGYQYQMKTTIEAQLQSNQDEVDREMNRLLNRKNSDSKKNYYRINFKLKEQVEMDDPSKMDYVRSCAKQSVDESSFVELVNRLIELHRESESLIRVSFFEKIHSQEPMFKVTPIFDQIYDFQSRILNHSNGLPIQIDFEGKMEKAAVSGLNIRSLENPLELNLESREFFDLLTYADINQSPGRVIRVLRHYLQDRELQEEFLKGYWQVHFKRYLSRTRDPIASRTFIAKTLQWVAIGNSPEEYQKIVERLIVRVNSLQNQEAVSLLKQGLSMQEMLKVGVGTMSESQYIAAQEIVEKLNGMEFKHTSCPIDVSAFLERNSKLLEAALANGYWDSVRSLLASYQKFSLNWRLCETSFSREYKNALKRYKEATEKLIKYAWFRAWILGNEEQASQISEILKSFPKVHDELIKSMERFTSSEKARMLQTVTRNNDKPVAEAID